MTALAAAMLAGCGGPQGDTMPLWGQAAAIRLVWNQIYGETKSPPTIYWRWDHCDEPNGIYPPLPWCTFDSDGERVTGLQDDAGWIELGGAWQTGKMSDTSIAHELLHASIGDTNHTSPKWAQLMPMTHDALIAAGL